MDRYSELKRKLKDREKVTMANVMLTLSPFMMDAMSAADCILLDKEHGLFGSEELIPLTMRCREKGIPSIVRVEDSEYHLIAKSIDLGADGIMLPRTERVEQVTVAYRGLCAGSNAHDAAPALHTTAEFGADQLRADVQALAQAAQPPFTLELQGVGSFTTVPYLAVSQGTQALQTLHEALVSEPYTPGWRYVPHVTVGQYGQQVPLMDAVAQLQAQGIGQSQLVLAVTELALVRYATHDIAGPLVVEGLWDLSTQRYVPQPGALLAL